MTTHNNIHKAPRLIVLAGLVVMIISILAGCANRTVTVAPATMSLAEPAPKAEDFIQKWYLLEPISVNGLNQSTVRNTVAKEYFPNQMTVIPKDGDKITYNEKEYVWHAIETKEYNYNLYYFANKYGKSATNALFWAVTVIDCPQEMTNVRLAIGTNAASIWWVNGVEVIGIYNDRQTTIDDGISKRLTLKKGQNIIRGAIINAGGATDFCVRFLDANEKPLKGYTVNIAGAQK
jgi:hypothetical protein